MENGGSLQGRYARKGNMKQQPKIPVSALRAEAQRLIAAGKMPDLATLLKTVSSVRAKYKPLILAEREHAREGR